MFLFRNFCSYINSYGQLSIFDKFSKLAVKRIGEWINGLPVSSQQLKNEVLWIKRDGQKSVLENPLQILAFEKESLQAQGKWADKNEKYYSEIVQPLLEEDQAVAIHQQQERDILPTVKEAEEIETKVPLPPPSHSPATTA